MKHALKSFETKLKTYVLTLTIATVFTLNHNALHAQTIPYSGGRIVISSDGNHHDHDDWAATPFTLALLAAKGLQDKVTVYTFSDHIWGSRDKAKQHMLISALEGKEQFGFDNTIFIEAVEDSTAAFNAITDEINKSDESDPLFIVAAGPMHVVGMAIDNAKEEKLKYVRIITHSKWNNKHSDHPDKKWENHTGWTWNEIKTTFEPKGLICDSILNQNGGKEHDGMRAIIEKFDWIKTSPYRDKPPYKPGSWDWLYERQETVIKKKGTEFDPSDAGMIIYLLTGIQTTDPEHAREIMENPVVRK